MGAGIVTGSTTGRVPFGRFGTPGPEVISSELNALTLDEIAERFAGIERLDRPLQAAQQVGLGYLAFNQPGVTLSGGEAQRLKIAQELCLKAPSQTLYILDEPTTGLHFEDVRVLLDVLHRLTDAGNTVIVIEHNLDLVKTADWIIDLGPEGGDGGGDIVVAGTPEDVVACADSHTGRSTFTCRLGSRSPISASWPCRATFRARSGR